MEVRKPSSVESYYKEILSDLIKYLALDVLNIDYESFGFVAMGTKRLVASNRT
jgi:hypothetical protein